MCLPYDFFKGSFDGQNLKEEINRHKTTSANMNDYKCFLTLEELMKTWERTHFKLGKFESTDKFRMESGGAEQTENRYCKLTYTIANHQ